MKTFSNSSKWIDKYLTGKLSQSGLVFFKAKLLSDPELRKDLYFQKLAMALIKLYHRKRVREDIENLHIKLFNDPLRIDFRNKMLNLFNNTL